MKQSILSLDQKSIKTSAPWCFFQVCITNYIDQDAKEAEAKATTLAVLQCSWSILFYASTFKYRLCKLLNYSQHRQVLSANGVCYAFGKIFRQANQPDILSP